MEYNIRYAAKEFAGEFYPILNGAQWGNMSYSSYDAALDKAKIQAGARAKTIAKRDKGAKIQIHAN